MKPRWLVTLGLLIAVVGCGPRNLPLAKQGADARDYRYEHLLRDDPANGEETFIIVTFSGGGTRAAAFAYGVTRALYEQRIAGERRLLDEVDVVSSVSGGSFAAAYLGLFGADEFITRFPDDVLYRNLELGIAGRLALPWNWVRLLSPRFSRSDIATAYYDDVIFRGKQFKDLPRRRPFIVLNATDIVEGAPLSFTQDQLDRLCSDLDPMPVARGVTASSAFPVAFPPVTLTNYPKADCGYQRPKWVDELWSDRDTNPPGHTLAANWMSYEQEKRRYIHLSDGGLGDNIGLRAPYNALEVNQWGLLERINKRELTRLVVITVDAKPKGESSLDGCARPASWFTVLNAAGTNPMENYAADTIELVRDWFDEWNTEARRYDRTQERCQELAESFCAGVPKADRCVATRRQACLKTFRATADRPVPHPTLYRVHVRFDAIDDDGVKKRLQNVDTRLRLSRDQVDELVDWGGKLLRKSEDYQELVKDLGGTIQGDVHETP
jgi:NTE family protein